MPAFSDENTSQPKTNVRLLPRKSDSLSRRFDGPATGEFEVVDSHALLQTAS